MEPGKSTSTADIRLAPAAPPTTMYALGGFLLAVLLTVVALCVVTVVTVTEIKNDMVTEVPAPTAAGTPNTNTIEKTHTLEKTIEHKTSTEFQEKEVAMYSESTIQGNNICVNKKPIDGAAPGDNYFKNQDCMVEGVVAVLEQAGANVTKGYKGDIDASSRMPITDPYYKQGLCPVNVHWHLGAEHLSVGQFDAKGTSPSATHGRKMLAEKSVREGFNCHYYDSSKEIYTKEYDWKHCVGMKVGQTYEVHWPHSAAGACGTPNQYQTPFYDGVFCIDGIVSLDPLNTYQKIGVQSQVYTIVNDENYYYPDMIRGMIVDGVYGKDVAYYTGSTTGTSRNNQVCSKYTPITWQVDRKCHLMSASSFDKMCADMKAQRDDMTDDLHAHGSRELVADHLAANNMQK